MKPADLIRKAFYPNKAPPPLFGGGVHDLKGAERAVWVGGIIRDAFGKASASRYDGQGGWSQLLAEGAEAVDAVRIVSLMAGHWPAPKPGVIRLIAAGSPEFKSAAIRAWSPAPCSSVTPLHPLPSVMMRGLDMDNTRGTSPKAHIAVRMGSPAPGCASLESVLEAKARSMCGAYIICIGDEGAEFVLRDAGLKSHVLWRDGLAVVRAG